MFKILLCFLAIPALLKAGYVENFIFELTETRFVGFSQAIANDMLFYALLWMLVYFSVLPNCWRWLSAFLRTLALLCWIIYCADYFVIKNFNTHLTFGDSIKYAGYAYKYLQQIYNLNNYTLSALCLLLLGALLPLLLSPFRLPKQKFKTVPWVLFISAILGYTVFADEHKYAHSWIYKNVVDYNLIILSEGSPYSAEFKQALHFDEAQTCQTLPSIPKNIIILMVESLSAYQSQFFSGIKDWTPNLDAIAQDNLAYRDFYANGFITEDGEISLLTGIPPIYPPSTYDNDGGTSFYSFFNLPDALPQALKKHHYHTEFLTSSDLEFGNTGQWAQSIGFDYVEGHDHPDYNAWERFHFKSAPDAALYLRVLDRLKQQKQNFFLFIKTVSSHHPYVNPETKHASEEEAIIYTDKQLGIFYQQLRNTGFFEHGILLIVGDHHAMTPLKPHEAERFGQYQAAAKVPLVVIDGHSHGQEAQQFQQIDVFNTVLGEISGTPCYSDWRGILWGTAKHSPKFIVHRRGDNRDKVSVFSQDAAAQIKLDGDATRVVSDYPEDPSIRQLIIDKINTLRITRSQWATATID